MGFGTDQGKLGNINGMAILAQALGKSIPETGTTTYRPNSTPPVRRLRRTRAGRVLDPVRKTCLHEWHAGRGVVRGRGQLEAALVLPAAGEDRTPPCAASAWRCATASASWMPTLGKIDIQGPDAVALLNWMYTNPWGKLEIGKCRYGLMLTRTAWCSTMASRQGWASITS